MTTITMNSIHTFFNPSPLRTKDFVKRILDEVSKDNCTAYAAAMAYYFFFALFPFMIFLTALLAYLPVPNLTEMIMGGIQEMVPREAFELVRQNVDKVVSQRQGGLLSFGILLSLWSSSSAIVAVMEGLNRTHGVEETRSAWKQRLIAILLVIGFTLFIAASTVLLMFGEKIGGVIAGKIGLGQWFLVTWNIARWPVLLFLVTVAISAIYYFAPNVKQSWRWVTPGSIITILIWLAVSVGFSYYVNNFGSYDKTYGGIGAIIALLTWMFISSLILLVGGEVNAEVAKWEGGNSEKQN